MTDLPELPSGRPARPTRRFATGRTVMALVLREMSTSYGRSPGGYIWEILQPVGGIVLLTFLFTLIARTPALGTNFPIFFATGMVPFAMYSSLSAKLAAALNYSRVLLFYPSVTFVDALIARALLTTLTQILVGYVVFSAILMLYETRTALDLPAIALSYSMAAALGIGVGVMNCFVMGMVPAWKNLWSILTRPLFLISCIFFLFESVPQPYRDWLWYNPLVHVVGQMRHGFYPYYDATYVSPAYVFSLGLALTALGLVLLQRYKLHILND